MEPERVTYALNTTRPCPACSGTQAKTIGEKAGFQIIVCDGCSTVFTATLPPNAEMPNYDVYYQPEHLDVPDFVVSRIDAIVAGFARHRKHNRLLDLGFGAGAIMASAKNMGWSVVGTEISAAAVDAARGAGFETFCGTLGEAAFPDDHFDVVTASEIVEHLADPYEVITEVRRVLRPGGLFWGTTPNGKSFSFKILGPRWSVIGPPDHLQLYSKKGLASILHAAGFSHLRIGTRGFNPYEVVSSFRHGKRTARDRPHGAPPVMTSRAVNEKFLKNRIGRSIKGSINAGLKITGLGDSLNFFAIK